MQEYDKIRIPYYFANLKSIKTGNIISLVDSNSHPFIWMAIQGEMGQYWHLLFWKEITKDEHDAFQMFHKQKLIF